MLDLCTSDCTASFWGCSIFSSSLRWPPVGGTSSTDKKLTVSNQNKNRGETQPMLNKSMCPLQSHSDIVCHFTSQYSLNMHTYFMDILSYYKLTALLWLNLCVTRTQTWYGLKIPTDWYFHKGKDLLCTNLHLKIDYSNVIVQIALQLEGGSLLEDHPADIECNREGLKTCYN